MVCMKQVVIAWDLRAESATIFLLNLRYDIFSQRETFYSEDARNVYISCNKTFFHSSESSYEKQATSKLLENNYIFYYLFLAGSSCSTGMEEFEFLL